MLNKAFFAFAFTLIFAIAFSVTGWASPEELAKIQRYIKENGLEWTAAETWISQLPPEERSMYLGGFLVDLPEDRSDWYRAPKGEKLPASFDWRNNGGDWTTSAKNQGYCGSCAAFSAVGSLEAKINIANGDPNIDLNLSEQHLFSCGGGSCSYGMYINDALDYMQYYGVPLESCFPYTAGDTGSSPSCSRTCSDWQTQARKIDWWSWVNGDLYSMKSAVYNTGPLITAFNACDDLYYYSGNVYSHPGSCSDCTRHGVLIVGYDDPGSYWIVKNSWGANWGENGFLRIKYGTCGIDSGPYSFGIKIGYTLRPDDVGGDDDDDDDDDGGLCDDVCYKLRYCGLIGDDISDSRCLSWCNTEMPSDDRYCVYGAESCQAVKDCVGSGSDGGDDRDGGDDDPLADFLDLLGCSYADTPSGAGGVGLLLAVVLVLGIWLKKKVVS